ncbi:hypothetical protein JCM10207_008531 [Rhodosporidiobolus poonsookiae]
MQTRAARKLSLSGASDSSLTSLSDSDDGSQPASSSHASSSPRMSKQKSKSKKATPSKKAPPPAAASKKTGGKKLPAKKNASRKAPAPPALPAKQPKRPSAVLPSAYNPDDSPSSHSDRSDDEYDPDLAGELRTSFHSSRTTRTTRNSTQARRTSISGSGTSGSPDVRRASVSSASAAAGTKAGKAPMKGKASAWAGALTGAEPEEGDDARLHGKQPARRNSVVEQARVRKEKADVQRQQPLAVLPDPHLVVGTPPLPMPPPLMTDFRAPPTPKLQELWEKRDKIIQQARLEAKGDISFQRRSEEAVQTALESLDTGGQQTALCLTMNRYSAFCALPEVDMPVFPLTVSKLLLFFSRVPYTPLAHAVYRAYPDPSQQDSYPLPRAGIADSNLSSDEGSRVTRELVKSWIEAVGYAQMATRDIWLAVFDPARARVEMAEGRDPTATAAAATTAAVAEHPSLASVSTGRNEAVLELLRAVEPLESIRAFEAKQHAAALAEQMAREVAARVARKENPPPRLSSSVAVGLARPASAAASVGGGMGKGKGKGKAREASVALGGSDDGEGGPEKKRVKWVKGGKAVLGPSPPGGARPSSSTSSLSAQAHLNGTTISTPALGMPALTYDTLTTTPQESLHQAPSAATILPTLGSGVSLSDTWSAPLPSSSVMSGLDATGLGVDRTAEPFQLVAASQPVESPLTTLDVAEQAYAGNGTLSGDVALSPAIAELASYPLPPSVAAARRRSASVASAQNPAPAPSAQQNVPYSPSEVFRMPPSRSTFPPAQATERQPSIASDGAMNTTDAGQTGMFASPATVQAVPAEQAWTQPIAAPLAEIAAAAVAAQKEAPAPLQQPPTESLQLQQSAIAAQRAQSASRLSATPAPPTPGLPIPPQSATALPRPANGQLYQEQLQSQAFSRPHYRQASAPSRFEAYDAPHPVKRAAPYAPNEPPQLDPAYGWPYRFEQAPHSQSSSAGARSGLDEFPSHARMASAPQPSHYSTYPPGYAAGDAYGDYRSMAPPPVSARPPPKRHYSELQPRYSAYGGFDAPYVPEAGGGRSAVTSSSLGGMPPPPSRNGYSHPPQRPSTSYLPAHPSQTPYLPQQSQTWPAAGSASALDPAAAVLPTAPPLPLPKASPALAYPTPGTPSLAYLPGAGEAVAQAGMGLVQRHEQVQGQYVVASGLY